MPRGGARVGAGRKPKGGAGRAPEVPTTPPPSAATNPEETPLEYMLRVMRDPGVDDARRDRLAVAAAPFLHPKIGEGGKKDQEKDRAADAATGKFAALPAPRLVSSNG